MRMSRIYLVLSIVSMMAAVFVGAAHKHHKKKKREARDCRVERQLPGGVAFDGSVTELQRDAFRMVQTRDYAAMLARAERLLQLDPDDPLNHEIKAYALRGHGMPRLSAESYEAAIQRALAEGSEDGLVLCDCYIGLAACQFAAGDRAEALKNIELALALTEQRRRAEQSEDAYYQLACAYAVRSTMVDETERAKERSRAIANLKFAIAAGYDGWDHMRNDLDLAPLHGYASFEELFPGGPLDE